MIHVGHVKWKKGVYVGRPSALGNPFIIGRDGNRAKVIRKYKHWLKKQIKNGDLSVLVSLEGIRVGSKKRHLNLLCYCYPAPCHADVIKEIVEAQEQSFLQWRP